MVTIPYDCTPTELKESQSVLVMPGTGRAQSRPRFSPHLFGWIFFVGLAVLFFILINRQEHQRTRRPRQPSPPEPPSLILHRRIGLTALAGSLALFVGGLWVATVFTRRAACNNAPGVQWTLSEAGITEIRGGKRIHRAWSYFHSFAETDCLVVIRDSLTAARPIPKRLFPDPEALARARALLVQHLAPPQ